MHRASNGAEREEDDTAAVKNERLRVSGTFALRNFHIPHVFKYFLRACPTWFNITPIALNAIFFFFSPQSSELQESKVTKFRSKKITSITRNLEKREFKILTATQKWRKLRNFEVTGECENSFWLLSGSNSRGTGRVRCIFQKQNCKRGDRKSGEPGQNYAARGTPGTRDRRK